MANKYIPATKREIMNYRREKAIKERQRNDITEKTYITLRRTFLSLRKQNPQIETTAKLLNDKIANEKHNTTIDIFRYLVSDIF